MKQTEPQELPEISPNDTSPSQSTMESRTLLGAVTPQGAAGSCPTCATAQAASANASPSCVYVIGCIEPRFPLLSVEKEFRQATARAGGATVDLTDRATMKKVLQYPNNRYLVRQLCWVLSVQGVETYILAPRDPADYDILVNAYRAETNPGDLDVVIGVRGPIASPSMCNGLMVPIVIPYQIYYFDRVSFLESIPKPKGIDGKKFVAMTGDMYDKMILQRDNGGNSDADRAVNYLFMRYDQIYVTAARAFGENASFTSIEVLPSPLTGTRKIVDVVSTFISRDNGVASKYFVRVDVTECFPFLVTKMSPYYDR